MTSNLERLFGMTYDIEHLVNSLGLKVKSGSTSSKRYYMEQIEVELPYGTVWVGVKYFVRCLPDFVITHREVGPDRDVEKAGLIWRRYDFTTVGAVVASFAEVDLEREFLCSLFSC